LRKDRFKVKRLGEAASNEKRLDVGEDEEDIFGGMRPGGSTMPMAMTSSLRGLPQSSLLELRRIGEGGG